MTEAEHPSSVLRRAASLMRERVSAATPGPWRAHEQDGNWYVSSDPYGLVSTGINEEPSLPEILMIERDRRDAEHVAGMDPLVGLALADLLDRIAWMTVLPAELAGRVGVDETLKVARAYLGENEPEGTRT